MSVCLCMYNSNVYRLNGSLSLVLIMIREGYFNPSKRNHPWRKRSTSQKFVHIISQPLIPTPPTLPYMPYEAPWVVAAGNI